MLNIVQNDRSPTPEASALIKALRNLGIEVFEEFHDGHKTVDLRIPQAKLDVEVDGRHHFTDPRQIIRDLWRSYYSHVNGIETLHIPNEMVRNHNEDIAVALAEAVKERERTINIHIV